MYIQMTTFSVPTFLVDGIVFALTILAAWVVLGVVGVTVYWFTAGKK